MNKRIKNLISILALMIFITPFFTNASSGGIDSVYKYAWGSKVGWINFNSSSGSVIVSDSELSGFVWIANYGWVNLNPSSSGVKNDGQGLLSGSAWGEQVGYIDFTGATIDASGYFHGYADGDITGMVSFNCENTDSCSSSDFKVKTDWRPPSSSGSTVTGATVFGASGRRSSLPVAIEEPESSSQEMLIPNISLVAAAYPKEKSIFVNDKQENAERDALFDITLSNEGLRENASPGESIVFSVKLTNFGSERRVDVTISYRLFDSEGKQIYVEEETLAVDTTASFIKRLPIPKDAPDGQYTIESSLIYAGQKAPAVSRFTFLVSQTASIPSMTRNYVVFLAVLIPIIILLIAISFMIHRRYSRTIVHDYFDKPMGERIYYEIISDTIGQMRTRAGNRALEAALHIEGLVVNEKTGRVEKITGSPAKVVADLVSGYERSLGKKVSFSLRKDK